MDRSNPGFSLLEAARIVARGPELDTKLDALAGQVLSAAGATAAVIYLLDPVANVLVPAAQSGLRGKMITARAEVPLDDPEELVAKVARERRQMSISGREAASAFTGQHPEWHDLVAVPLVAADETGGEDAEGVLLAAYEAAPPEGSDDLLTALADLSAIAIRQARLQRALLERADWIGRLASTDPLTGLANRVTFERMLELELARATRQESQLSVLLFDVDGFAQINSDAGSPAGDEVLRHVAATLADQVRLVDTVARYGGDEFALIAPGGGGEVVGRRVRDALLKREAAGKPISVSVGAVVYPIDGATTTELLIAAANALAEAKRRGRGSIFVASGS
ncbi:MAG TPA: diguanylate cyclase [Candidatus Limnocylindrales bacterium]|jgi:diguanylate cyclase (GGDEF)-like protein